MAKHCTELTAADICPTNSTPCHAEQKKNESEKAEVYEWLCINYVGPARSEWASPFIFGSKEIGSLRICISYTELNSVSVEDAYLIPPVDKR